MKHVLAQKGVFFLENPGVPDAPFTDFGETIPNGSLCVDKSNGNLYIFQNPSWVLVGTGGSGGNTFSSDITFSSETTKVVTHSLGLLGFGDFVIRVFNTSTEEEEEFSKTLIDGNSFNLVSNSPISGTFRVVLIGV